MQTREYPALVYEYVWLLELKHSDDANMRMPMRMRSVAAREQNTAKKQR